MISKRCSHTREHLFVMLPVLVLCRFQAVLVIWKSTLIAEAFVSSFHLLFGLMGLFFCQWNPSSFLLFPISFLIIRATSIVSIRYEVSFFYQIDKMSHLLYSSFLLFRLQFHIP